MEQEDDMDCQEEFTTHITLPGDLITNIPGYMRGHGTFAGPDGELISTVGGRVERINKLVSVHAPRARFVGETGDVVVGRIIEVQVGSKRWKVETNSRLDSILLLASINLPGGELRRKTIEDELMMRSFFKEGDLIVAEVQSVFQDGALSLHTRSLRYGRIGQGVLIKVAPSLIQRRKTHFHNLPSLGLHIILANNGLVWISPPRTSEEVEYGFDLSLEPVSLSTRQAIARMRNCVAILSKGKIMLNSRSCSTCFEESMEFEVKELLRSQCIDKVIRIVRNKLNS